MTWWHSSHSNNSPSTFCIVIVQNSLALALSSAYFLKLTLLHFIGVGFRALLLLFSLLLCVWFSLCTVLVAHDCCSLSLSLSCTDSFATIVLRGHVIYSHIFFVSFIQRMIAIYEWIRHYLYLSVENMCELLRSYTSLFVLSHCRFLSLPKLPHSSIYIQLLPNTHSNTLTISEWIRSRI